jgi:3-deoxy-D-manno-octulosonate 8-phosphate phosphatase (KDO 8-P phosphatase)
MALVQRFADKLKVTDVYKGCHDKAQAVCQIASQHQLQLSEICYIGDDVIDLPAMAAVGLAAAPADAQPGVRAKAHLVTSSKGGQGAVREVLDAILAQQSRA